MKKSLLNDQGGLMYILLVVFIFAAGVFAVMGYTVSMTHSIYQQAGRTLERAGNVAVIVTKENVKTRDLELNLSDGSVEDAFENNLAQAGLTKTSDGWIYENKGKTVYSIESVNLTINGEILQVNANLKIPLMWNLGQDTMEQEISVETRSHIMYYIP